MTESQQIRLAALTSIEDCRSAVSFQEEVWGSGFSERVPSSILMVVQKVGGVAIGAFDPGGRIVGFVFGLTGVTDGEVVHWSDMMGVAEGYRDQGLGYRLKLAQRKAAIRVGAVRMCWSFDPLEARNAWFNIQKLGATAHAYVEDMYGPSDSPLHEGLGTDRLIAEWLFDPKPHEEESARREVLRVPIPLDVQRLKLESPEEVLRWRGESRQALIRAFKDGLRITKMERGTEHCEYVLTSTTEP